ncbi:RNA polymerase sigma factor sigE, chloroplastic/mitochondrial [Sesamum alatum]|uniref:RNA polymerase sigma factor sigE, chloroplastic/mitochondrial n=1 Tax=Sesamum alatum TaxID=300844 RepID=A0AAE2CRC0_9LAMI|nr:RNA polymerase sigma factor sigE, chloroplastic/mitochondrial [Sesamum alatum]
MITRLVVSFAKRRTMNLKIASLDAKDAKFSEQSNEEILFYSSSGGESKSMWYLDSGCSSHMIGDWDIFVDLNPNITSQIILGDGSRKSAEGKGTIVVQTRKGEEKLITDSAARTPVGLKRRGPPTVVSDEEVDSQRLKRAGEGEETEKKTVENVERSQSKKGKRLSLEKRIALRMKEQGDSTSFRSSEHDWLFKLMQPMKKILHVKETLQADLGREPTDDELAEATHMDAVQLWKQMEIGPAARNKLIKHNLRLVLFVMNKYPQDFCQWPRFQDFVSWHAIVRSMTLSSITKVSLAFNRSELKTREPLFELQRPPTKEEIIERVGISPEQYHEVMKVSKPISSLHAEHEVSSSMRSPMLMVLKEIISLPALVRLALDDVVNSSLTLQCI